MIICGLCKKCVHVSALSPVGGTGGGRLQSHPMLTYFFFNCWIGTEAIPTEDLIGLSYSKREVHWPRHFTIIQGVLKWGTWVHSILEPVQSDGKQPDDVTITPWRSGHPHRVHLSGMSPALTHLHSFVWCRRHLKQGHCSFSRVGKNGNEMLTKMHLFSTCLWPRCL